MITIEEMETTEKRTERFLEIEEAIKISKLICSVSEERIPMVLSVLEKAGVFIQGLDELEEWKLLKEQAYLIELNEFLETLFLTYGPFEERIEIRPADFETVCKKFNVKPSCAKRLLYRKGHIRTTESPKGVINYTVPIWINGKAERRVVILRDSILKELPNERGD